VPFVHRTERVYQDMKLRPIGQAKNGGEGLRPDPTFPFLEVGLNRPIAVQARTMVAGSTNFLQMCTVPKTGKTVCCPRSKGRDGSWPKK